MASTAKIPPLSYRPSGMVAGVARANGRGTVYNSFKGAHHRMGWDDTFGELNAYLIYKFLFYSEKITGTC